MKSVATNRCASRAVLAGSKHKRTACLLSGRQEDRKDTAASARCCAAADMERATVLLHYISDQGEPQAATAGTFRGKEGLEYLVQVVRSYAAAVIRKRHP